MWEIRYESGGRVGGFASEEEAKDYLHAGDEPGEVRRTPLPNNNDAQGWDDYRAGR